MKLFLQQAIRVLSSRLARNVYFWVFLFWVKHEDVSNLDDYPKAWYYGLLLLTMSVFVILTYLNNLWLVPRFLARKKYRTYFCLVSMITLIIGFGYTLLVKGIIVAFPLVDNCQISIISSPLTADTSFASVLDEMWIYLVSMAVWVFLFTSLWFLNDYSRKEKMMQEAMKKQVEAELNFLKNQINPHFLFNTLNNLYSLTLTKSDDAPDLILKLSSMLRYLLYESNVSKVSFEKEKEMMQAYIDIELLRIPENDNMSFSMISDNQDFSIPPLLWLPILENVFKHGPGVMDSGFIDYRFVIKGNNMSIYSRNSFKLNVQKSNMEGSGGIGLNNLAKRLELLYPGRHSLKCTAGEGYYTVELEISDL